MASIGKYSGEVPYIAFNAKKSFIENNKDILSDFEVIKGDMDDVFLKVTGKVLE